MIMRALPELIDEALCHGWTLTALAGASGVSQPNITKLRKGLVSQQSKSGMRLRTFLEDGGAGDGDRVLRAASAALRRVLGRHPSKHREIIHFIRGLDMLLSEGTSMPTPPKRSPRGRKPLPREVRPSS